MSSRMNRGRSVSALVGRPIVRLVFALTLLFLIFPIVVTFVASFAREWTGVLPSGFVTLAHWEQVLGLAGYQDAANYSLRLGDVLKTAQHDPIGALSASPLFRSVLLALGGVAINLVVGVPIAYAVARYRFRGREWLNALAVLPLAPGIILGVAFLRAYPELSGTDFGLIIGYSLLKAPFMVLAVQSSFEAMPLRQLEESARSLGASWLETFLFVIVPNAKRGIVSGAIICWALAAAEFNFSYVVFSRGARPLALFLKANISNSSFLTTSAAVSVFFLLVAGVTLALQLVGTRGFTTRQ
ncbi:ABC-type spermidine/putrescine transport system, permease component II [Halogeometricum borinquense DSM 11551]|uniref:ABC-type spermidine/putrescine transport system, permease component II n=2 Tax=Halogeometricum borinquense TaxID=60847 RepID=E4NUC4_HALBP|nr:ABC transporter permease subunit [Halogeometricum borinquense]ADQ68644.1 ABC-type spermidine/putrescine transport system, permease component II [Halogeometricum borinquense DSM 11551]ELY25386.1 ABC-type spermidine/putrescine transport system, permease component II [Halogeometricum borinquense DSM 11551]RYJ14288.1 ABC transporter permease subunit [Halogeometricum borinquense]